jgi:hypothetical protein
VLGATKEVLARNELYGLGVEHEAPFKPGQTISVQTQVNMPEPHLAGMTDDELARYKNLLLELRELLAAEHPKMLAGHGEPINDRLRAVNSY